MNGESSNDKNFAQAIQEAAPRLEALQGQLTALMDQIVACWREIEPTLRAWVTQCEAFSDDDWLDLPESTRELYQNLRRALRLATGEE